MCPMKWQDGYGGCQALDQVLWTQTLTLAPLLMSSVTEANHLSPPGLRRRSCGQSPTLLRVHRRNFPKLRCNTALLLAGHGQADRPAQGQRQQQVPIKDSAEEVREWQAGVRGVLGNRKINDSVTNTCLPEHRQDDKENSLLSLTLM